MDDLNALIDQAVTLDMNRPARNAQTPYGAPYYAAAPNALSPVYYPAAYAAPTMYVVQPVVPVQVLAPVPKHHHNLLHHNKY